VGQILDCPFLSIKKGTLKSAWYSDGLPRGKAVESQEAEAEEMEDCQPSMITNSPGLKARTQVKPLSRCTYLK
jgi:hypothetical protein